MTSNQNDDFEFDFSLCHGSNNQDNNNINNDINNDNDDVNYYCSQCLYCY